MSMPGFELHLISAPETWNKESLLPADIDRDGDTDFFSGEGRGGRSYWFENLGIAGWAEHLVSDSDNTDVGAVALDIDGDGWMDKVAGTFWYRNTGHPRDSAFQLCRDSAQEYVHDMLAADIDGDGKKDIINIDYDGIRWFTVPADSRCLPWTTHKVNGSTTNLMQHGGIAVGDMDGDGDMDISRMDRWFENTNGKGLVWTEHINIDFGQVGLWGLSGKARILEGDGDWDIFSFGGPGSIGIPQAYVWENTDGKGGNWIEHIVSAGTTGHEGIAFDIDGDGDADVVSKPFGRGNNFYFENLYIHSSSTLPFYLRRTNFAHPSGSNAKDVGHWEWNRPGFEKEKFNTLGQSK